MREGKYETERAESAPDHVEIEPHTREKRGELYDGRTDAPDRFVAEQSAESESDSDEEKRGGQRYDVSKQYVRGKTETEAQRDCDGKNELRRNERQNGQRVSENIVARA